MSWSLTFIDLEGDGPRSFGEVQDLMNETSPETTPTANIQRLAARLLMRFPEPIAWGFTARGRLLGASFEYGSFDTDVVLGEADAAHAAMFDQDHETVFAPTTLDWPWIASDWLVQPPHEPDPAPPRLTIVQPGDRVAHDEFGDGTVISTSVDGDFSSAKVAFDDAGTRHLVLRFAPLRLL